MTLVQEILKIPELKFCFGKSNVHLETFANDINACSMYLPGFGLGIPSNLSAENMLRSVFLQIIQQNGWFIFNISGVDLKKAKNGIFAYQEAEEEGIITEWELSIILTNRDYLKKTIFHNGKVKFKKRLLWNSIA